MPKKKLWFCFILVLACLLINSPGGVFAQESTPTSPTPAVPGGVGASITATPARNGLQNPGKNDMLRGVVEIKGTALADWSLSFAYTNDPSQTWFGLTQSTDPVVDGVFYEWDTTKITDGEFILRLQVLEPGGVTDIQVPVRISNYLPVDTETPVPTALVVQPTVTSNVNPEFENSSPTAELSPTPLVFVTLPPLPQNPAIVQPAEILSMLGKGVLAVVVLFLMAGLGLALRRK